VGAEPVKTRPTPTDLEAVTELIGRPPMGTFEVVLRRADRSPVVLSNEPLLHNGRPMPTRFWLADRALRRVVGRLESEGGVGRAEAEVPWDEIEATHAAAAAERDGRIPAGYHGHRPSGGVGGTRLGVKCLHAHYANHLAGAYDAVGLWVEAQLEEMGAGFNPDQPGIMTTWSSQ